MAVPSGYIWARDVDPYAKWNAPTKTLTASGKQYKPGQYYSEGGRTYIQNPVPEGYRWLREMLPSGVKYDPTTRTATLPYGATLPISQGVVVGGKTYVHPQQMAALYSAYRPERTISPEAVSREAEIQAQILEPQRAALAKRLSLNTQELEEAAKARRREAELSYQLSQSDLEKREEAARMAATQSAGRRGISSSPFALYEQRKVGEEYAPHYTELARNRDVLLANIASEAALATEKLAQQGREQEAQWASAIMQQAYKTLQSDWAEQQENVQKLADYFTELAKTQAEERQKAAELAWKKQEAFLPYTYLTQEEKAKYDYLTKALGQQKEIAGWPYEKPTMGESLDYELGKRNIALQRELGLAKAAGSGGPQTARERAFDAETKVYDKMMTNYEADVGSVDVRSPVYDFNTVTVIIRNALTNPDLRKTLTATGGDWYNTLNAFTTTTLKKPLENYVQELKAKGGANPSTIMLLDSVIAQHYGLTADEYRENLEMNLRGAR